MGTRADESRTRRELLVGVFGGLAGAVAASVMRPTEAAAADANDPNAIHKGVNNTGSVMTTVTCTGQTAFKGSASGGSNLSGLLGVGSGTGSRGVTGNGATGVFGQSTGPAGRGVLGSATGATGFGVMGDSKSVTGVNAGVFGRTASPQGAGVSGSSTATTGIGAGVLGTSVAPNGSGVKGTHTAGGFGVLGHASGVGGCAGLFEASGDAFGLIVSGPAQFSTSGIATVAAGQDSVFVTPGIPITATSKILCTVMGFPGPSVTLFGVDPDPSTDQFEIILTGQSTSNCKVAWFLME